MKKLTSFLLGGALLLATVSCKKDLIGEGPVSSETRTVSSFTAIDLRMNGNVYYIKSATPRIEITAKQSILPILQTSVAANRLTIRYNNGKTYDADASIRVNVYGPDVNSFELNTSGSIFCTDEIQTPSVLLRSAGSGNIYMQKITAANIEAITSVSGNITVASGSSSAVKLRSSASGNIDLSGLATVVATAHSSGSGDIRVRVSDNLNATIDGSGNIFFRGNPLLSTHIGGSGNLVRF